MTTGFEPPRKLTPTDFVDGFCCGVQLVDDWVCARAREAEKHGTAVVYAVYSDGVLAGVYSLCSHSVARAEVQGGWLKRNSPESIPAILLGMLGVDVRFQGMGLGASLLGDALRRSLSVSKQIGAKALLVDPIDDIARGFYRKYGFKPIPDMERMFIPLNRTV